MYLKPRSKYFFSSRLRSRDVFERSVCGLRSRRLHRPGYDLLFWPTGLFPPERKYLYKIYDALTRIIYNKSSMRLHHSNAFVSEWIFVRARGEPTLWHR